MHGSGLSSGRVGSHVSGLEGIRNLWWCGRRCELRRRRLRLLSRRGGVGRRVAVAALSSVSVKAWLSAAASGSTLSISINYLTKCVGESGAVSLVVGAAPTEVGEMIGPAMRARALWLAALTTRMPLSTTA